MAADEYVATNVTNSLATIRFYTWEPSAISLGVHQSPDAINLSLCSAKKWDVVRRPTGGRALLHDGDLSYSVVIPGGSTTPSNLRILYERIAIAWQEALRSLGISALYSSKNSPSNRSNRLREGLCLDSRVRGELSAGGKKVAAAAQRIFPMAILQHGSLPLRGDVSETADVLHLSEQARAIAKEGLGNSAWSVSQAAGKEILPSNLIDAVLKPLAAQFEFDYFQSEWAEVELEAIPALRSKFEILSTGSVQAVDV